MIRRLTKREERILIVCLTAVFLFVSYHAVFQPLLDKIESVDHEIERKRQHLIKDARVIHKAAALQGIYDAYVEQFRQTQPNERVMSTLISEIEKVADGLDLHIAELKPKRVKQEEFLNQFSVSLTIESELVNILEFIHTLQQEPHLFDVEEVRFDQGPRRDQPSIRTQLVLGKILIP